MLSRWIRIFANFTIGSIFSFNAQYDIIYYDVYIILCYLSVRFNKIIY